VLDHLQEGRLLPRPLDELAAHSGRFVVAVSGPVLTACAELAPLSDAVAEVRSLVVGAAARNRGVGRALVNELTRRAACAGFSRLCAFTHAPTYFTAMGFSLVPHAWLPEKLEQDCRGCEQFRACGQSAVVRDLSVVTIGDEAFDARHA
jgi:amino-acid N-acetyltransferase